MACVRVGTAEQRVHLGAEAPVGQADGGVHEHAEGTAKGHDAGGPRSAKPGPLALLDQRQCGHLEHGGRDRTVLAGSSVGEQAGR